MKDLIIYTLSKKQITQESLEKYVQPVLNQEMFENPLGGIFGQTDREREKYFIYNNGKKLNNLSYYNNSKYMNVIKVKDDAKVWYIDNYDALKYANKEILEKIKSNRLTGKQEELKPVFKDGKFNYEMINKLGYDAICINPKFCRGIFDSWGGESVLILNPKCCEVLENEKFNPLKEEVKQRRQSHIPENIDFDKKWNDISKAYYKLEKLYEKDIKFINKIKNKQAIFETDAIKFKNNAAYRVSELNKLNEKAEELVISYDRYLSTRNIDIPGGKERLQIKLESFRYLKNSISKSIVENNENILGEQGLQKFVAVPENIKKEKFSSFKNLARTILKKVNANYDGLELEQIKTLANSHNNIRNFNDDFISSSAIRAVSIRDLNRIYNTYSLPDSAFKNFELYQKNPSCLKKFNDLEKYQILTIDSYNKKSLEIHSKENDFFELERDGKKYFARAEWVYDELGGMSALQVTLFNESAKKLELEKDVNSLNYRKLSENAYWEKYFFSSDLNLMKVEVENVINIGKKCKKVTTEKAYGACEIIRESDIIRTNLLKQIDFIQPKFKTGTQVSLLFNQEDIVKKGFDGEILEDKVISFTGANFIAEANKDNLKLSARVLDTNVEDIKPQIEKKNISAGIEFTGIKVNTKGVSIGTVGANVKAASSIRDEKKNKDTKSSLTLGLSSDGKIKVDVQIGEFSNKNTINPSIEGEVESSTQVYGELFKNTLKSNGRETTCENSITEGKEFIDSLIKENNGDIKKAAENIKKLINRSLDTAQHINEAAHFR